LEEVADVGEPFGTFFVKVELDGFIITFIILNNDTTLVEVDEGVVDKLRRDH
jgi:hypothetical protein